MFIFDKNTDTNKKSDTTSNVNIKERKKKIEIHLENTIDEDSESLESSIQSVIENDKDILIPQDPNSEIYAETSEESILHLKNKFNFVIQIRELMKENEKMKQENFQINEEISRIKAESESADMDLIQARQAFEQRRVENIRVIFNFKN